MISISSYQPEHHGGVLEVILPIQQQEFGIPITLEQQPDLSDIPNFYQRGTGGFWVALASGEVTGTVALIDIGNQQTALRKMFVKETWRGKEKGVALKLLNTLVRHAKEKGVREIFLGTTAKYVAAHHFYEKNGFEEIAKVTLPLAFPMIPVDTKFYRMRLE